MESSSKRWVLEAVPATGSEETQTAADDGSTAAKAFISLPTEVKSHLLFTNPQTWLPMTIESAYAELMARADDNQERILDILTFEGAIHLHYLSIPSIFADPVKSKESLHNIINVVIAGGLQLQKLENSATRIKIRARLTEFVASLFALLLKRLSDAEPQFLLELTSQLSLLCTEASKWDESLVQELKEAFTRSPLRSGLVAHKNIEIPLSVLHLELDILLLLQKSRPLPTELVRGYLQSAESVLEQAIEVAAPVLERLEAVTNASAFITGPIAIYLLSYLSDFHALDRTSYDKTQASADTALSTSAASAVHLSASSLDTLRRLADKLIPDDFVATVARFLVGASPEHATKASKAVSYWLAAAAPSNNGELLLLNAISTTIFKSNIITSKYPVLSSTIKHICERQSWEERFQYVQRWLVSYETLSSLDRVLTQIQEEDELKPAIDLLEIGFDLLHILTPASKPETTSSSNLPSIDVNLYHQLVNLILDRLNVPDYFFYLGETRNFDSANYKFAEMRVKTFQHLVGHYWVLLEHLLQHMPDMSLLTKDNPTLLMPEGVKPPVEVAPWFDRLFVTMTMHGMRSDFSTVKNSNHVIHCLASLLNIPSMKALPKNPLVLRLRSVLAFIRSLRSVDEPSRFGMLMWICNRVPLQELDEKDTFDKMVASEVVKALLDALGDYRTPVKLEGLKFVIKICTISSAIDTETSPEKASNDANFSSKPSSSWSAAKHLPPSVFDAIIRSFTFREAPVIDLGLQAATQLIRAQQGSMRVPWATSLMSTINYELDYIQKPDLIQIYLERLPAILPCLETKLISFVHPLLVRMVALLDVGTFQMMKLSLENISWLVNLAWPCIDKDSELVVGALATAWLDHVLVLPHETTSALVTANIEVIRSKIITCLTLLVAIVATEKLQRLTTELDGLEELKDFQRVFSDLISKKDLNVHRN